MKICKNGCRILLYLNGARDTYRDGRIFFYFLSNFVDFLKTLKVKVELNDRILYLVEKLSHSQVIACDILRNFEQPFLQQSWLFLLTIQPCSKN